MIKTFAQLKKIAATSLTLAAILLSNTAVAAVTAQHLYIGTTMKTGITVTTPDGHKTLNAHWGKQPDLYDVWIASADFSKTYTAPKIIGWDFLGWYRVSSKTTNPYYYTTFPGGGSVFNVQVSADYEFVPQSGVELSSLYQDVSGAFNALFVLKYKEATYTVSFDTSSSVTWTKPSDMTATGGATIKLPTPNYNPGVVFNGWYSDPDCTNTVGDGGIEYQPTKTETLYAGWIPEKHTMTFNPGQGEVSVTSKTVTYGEPYGELPIPTRKGYKFVGWTYNGDTITEDDIFETASDIIVKADWEEVAYHIILQSNYKGRYEEKSGSKPFKPDFSEVEIYPASTYKFTQPGLEFLGWDFDPDATTPKFEPRFTEIGQTFADELKGDETDVYLYAIWKVLTYTVHFDASDATGGTMTDQVIERETATKLTKNAFTRTGYVFKQWKCDALSKTFADEEEVTNLAAVDQTVTLVAEWEAIKQKVSFDANWNGPVGSLVTTTVPDPIELNFGESKPIEQWKPVNTLAEFLGWAMKADATKVDFTTEVKNLPAETAITLYAVWVKKDMTLSEAVGCDNLVLTSVAVPSKTKGDGDPWSKCADGIQSGVIYPMWESGGFYDCYSEVTAELPEAGSLVFSWYVRDINGGRSCFMVDSKEVSGVTATETEGRAVYKYDADAPVKISWRAYGTRPEQILANVPSNLVITSVRWYPAGVNPEPTPADAPVISSDYSFVADSMFDYVIEAKDALTEIEWTTVNVVTGDGSAISLPMTPTKEHPQRFLRVRVIQRGAQ